MFIQFASQNGVDYYFDERGVVAVISNQPLYSVIGHYKDGVWQALTMVTLNGYSAELIGSSGVWSNWKSLGCAAITGMQAEVSGLLEGAATLRIVGSCDGVVKTFASMTP